jgi:hypothetical protein
VSNRPTKPDNRSITVSPRTDTAGFVRAFAGSPRTFLAELLANWWCKRSAVQIRSVRFAEGGQRVESGRPLAMWGLMLVGDNRDEGETTFLMPSSRGPDRECKRRSSADSVPHRPSITA